MGNLCGPRCQNSSVFPKISKAAWHPIKKVQQCNGATVQQCNSSLEVHCTVLQKALKKKLSGSAILTWICNTVWLGSQDRPDKKIRIIHVNPWIKQSEWETPAWLQRSSAQTALEQFKGEISSLLVYTVIFLLHVLMPIHWCVCRREMPNKETSLAGRNPSNASISTLRRRTKKLWREVKVLIEICWLIGSVPIFQARPISIVQWRLFPLEDSSKLMGVTEEFSPRHTCCVTKECQCRKRILQIVKTRIY